ncbi:MAG TPA: CocE/NonD family hydrolase [Gaiellaceae bacterium]|nr:CocE/NonD family hydrolase [Gaiellaceae bacterium]
MGRARVAFAVLAAALACAGSASAAAGWTEVTIPASDATPLACAYIVPSGTAPAGGWPGVILFHGLGQSHADLEPIGTALAQLGFAALACDARGTGGSGGKFGLDGTRDVQDAQDLFSWFAGRSDVSDTRIGAFGLSLGGGEVWNAAVAGVPFKAIVPAITWTDLGAALDPDGVPKSGMVGILSRAVPPANWDPALAEAAQALLAGSVTPAVRNTEATRSSRSQLHALTVPTLLLQGRRDFFFDMDQAIAAWKLLAGPKRLYLGDLGHAPAKNPADEESSYFAEAVVWFQNYVSAGSPAGIPGGVELAHDPWDGQPNVYKKLPATRKASVNLPGKTKLGGGGFATRSARLTGGPYETFGHGFVTVHYSGATNWTHLVATVLVKGSKTPVTEGAAPIKSSSGVVKIPLLNQAVRLPRGKKLVVELGATSADDVNHVGVPIYASAVPGGASITLGSSTLKLSFLEHTVSR